MRGAGAAAAPERRWPLTAVYSYCGARRGWTARSYAAVAGASRGGAALTVRDAGGALLARGRAAGVRAGRGGACVAVALDGGGAVVVRFAGAPAARAFARWVRGGRAAAGRAPA